MVRCDEPVNLNAFVGILRDSFIRLSRMENGRQPGRSGAGCKVSDHCAEWRCSQPEWPEE